MITKKGIFKRYIGDVLAYVCQENFSKNNFDL